MKITNLVLGAICLTAISCNDSVGGNGPEKATETYVSMIAKADYEKALEVSTGPATETVNQMKETDANGYETKIVEVKCEVDNEAETAKCKCTERRIDSTTFLNYKYDSFIYELEKLDNTWKVSSQTKDMPMPDMGDMGFGDEDMMEEAPVEPVMEDGEAAEDI
ncbi:MAG: hypothetical protein AB8B74_10635 [Crocinitomicaceae bacterium]